MSYDVITPSMAGPVRRTNSLCLSSVFSYRL